MPVIPAIKKLRQKDLEMESNLGYIMRPYLKKKKKWIMRMYEVEDLEIQISSVMTKPSN
jgi:hypothetical protein